MGVTTLTPINGRACMCGDNYILLLQYLFTHMHFIKKTGYKRFSKTNSADLRQRIPLTYSSFMAFGKFRALKERYRIGKK